MVLDSIEDDNELVESGDPPANVNTDDEVIFEEDPDSQDSLDEGPCF